MARLGLLSRSRFGLGVIAFGVVLIAVVSLVTGMRSASASQSVPDAVDPLPVATSVVRFAEAGEIEARYPALVAARRESALGFEAGGRIAAVLVDVGDQVEDGDVLARLDTRALQASLAAAEADELAAQARADLARLTLERQQTLVDRGHISAQRLDEVAADARSAQAQAAAARAQAETLQVRIDLATITAPFTGVVTARMFDEGAIASPGAPVLNLVEAGDLELRAGLPEREAANLIVGDRYQVDVGSQRVEATLRAVTGVLDAQRQSVSAVFDIPAEAGVRSGEVARLVLPTVIESEGFWAPVTALSEGRRGLWSIYVVAGSGDAERLEPRPVEIIHTEADRVYLSGAVRDGEVFVSAGVHRAAPGQRVRAANESSPQ
ncbi:efflux RND transporter periplasmic adaptor subunit [Maricaulaceae bacterium EIL42A08]|nr:efflux RND transporter periplasmic adaptor subunit [Maricaulaceae bacterium EIL42A08]